MNFLETIQNQNLIDDTWLPVIFGDLLDDEEYWWDPDYDLARLAYSICVFYFGLIQGYCFAKAQNEGKKLNEASIDSNIVTPISNIWNVDTHNKFITAGELFSYLISASRSNSDTSIFSPEFKDEIIEIKKAYERITGNSRAFLQVVAKEQFLSFLKSLPLLRTSTFDKDTLKISFLINNNKVTIKASPFISFLDFDSNPFGEPIEALTTNCYILASVSKGEKNDELFFDTIRLDSTNIKKDKKKICRQIASNENLKLLCQTANLETQWYPLDDCWCDLQFLNKMVNATEQVLFALFGIDNIEFQKSENIKDKLFLIIGDTEFYHTLKHKEQIKASELNDILFELFLSEGLFKSVKNILLNPTKEKKLSSDKMFESYLNKLSEQCNLSKEGIQKYRDQCQAKIDDASKKLAHIVSPKRETYKNRYREIDAEWRTYYILKAAGIKSSSLFADIETILSIDDYYDMLCTNDSSAEYDLMQLLRMLCIFYQALLKNGSVFNEQKFLKDVEKITPEYTLSNHTIESLFDKFIKIAKDCEKSPNVSKLLGRSGLGTNAAAYIEFCKNKIVKSKQSPEHRTYTFDRPNEHSVFISYAHEDLDIVKPIIERWRKLGIDLFFDDSNIHDGQNWEKIAMNCIESDKCQMFVIFCSETSLTKQGVLKELLIANKKQKEKKGEFIIPVNLVANKNIKDYLLQLTVCRDENKKKNADAIWNQNLIETEASYLDYHTLSCEELDKKIRQDYERLTDSDGQVVTPYELDDFKLSVAHFYAYLKSGKTSTMSVGEVDTFFKSDNNEPSKCIYPIVASIKEARIKRDNIAIVGYELIRGKGHKSKSSHILTSKALDVDDYYCIPKYRNADNPGKYMIEPLLIKCDKFLEILSKPRGEYDE